MLRVALRLSKGDEAWRSGTPPMAPAGMMGRFLLLTGGLRPVAQPPSAGNKIVTAGGSCATFLLIFAERVPFLGKLPGDIAIQRRSFTLYIPITTCIILSIILSLIFRLLIRR